MRLRFKFTKTGRLKYIGHLDVLNIWNRAVKSAALPVMYSNGFNPHMLMSFATPLPLGLTSISEYVDVDFNHSLQIADAVKTLNKRFPDGMEITSAYTVCVPYKRIASVVTAAEYAIVTPIEISEERLERFMARDCIEIVKKTKRKCEMTDIRPDILSAHKTEYGILAVLSCGSVRNLKPTLFMSAFCDFYDIECPDYKTKIERVEIFGDADGGLAPVSDLCQDGNIKKVDYF